MDFSLCSARGGFGVLKGHLILSAKSQLCVLTQGPNQERGLSCSQPVTNPAPHDHSLGPLRAQEPPGSEGTFSQAACPPGVRPLLPRHHSPPNNDLSCPAFCELRIMGVSLPASKDADSRAEGGQRWGRFQNYVTVWSSVLGRLPGPES